MIVPFGFSMNPTPSTEPRRYTGGLDGIFGVKTRNSVISYQAKNNLSQDGIIGVNTWRKLMSDVVGKGAGDNTVM